MRGDNHKAQRIPAVVAPTKMSTRQYLETSRLMRDIEIHERDIARDVSRDIGDETCTRER